MISLDIEMRLTVTGEHDLEAEGEQLMSALVVLEDSCDIADTAVSVDLARRAVTIELTAQGATFEDAEEVASSTIRAAIHQIGGATPGWDISARSAELTPA